MVYHSGGMMGNSTFEQVDYGAGIYRGRSAPPASVYDAVNALVNDEGLMFKRASSAYVTTSDAGSALHTLKSSYFPAPSAIRTVAFSDTNHYVVNGTAFRALGYNGLGPFPPPLSCRIAAVNRFIVWPYVAAAGSFAIALYGGSLSPMSSPIYTDGTVTATDGSATVTGSGTSWLANVDAGTFMQIAGANEGFWLVKEVLDNTTITLDQPWSGSTGSGKSYTAAAIATTGVIYDDIFQPSASDDAVPYVAYVGRRLLLAYGTRIAFTAFDNPASQAATDYHELPGDAFITGLDGIGDTASVHTTEGAWSIQNMLLDPVDDAGNIQHIVGPVNKDVLLWGDSGIAAWAGGFVVPAVDDVHLLGADGVNEPITSRIRPLYRGYVKAGYRPGLATVHRGHYFLPILNGTTLVDVLVCRLDRSAAWTRWAGHAAAPAFATQVGASTRSPKLYGVQGQRVLDLTGCLDAVSAGTQDANSTTPVFRVDENDIDTGGGIRPNTTEKVRYIYETTGGTPTVAVSSSTGPEGSSFAAATLKRGGGASDGTDYSAWVVARKAERIRFRFECSSQVNSLILRRREATVRQAAQN